MSIGAMRAPRWRSPVYCLDRLRAPLEHLRQLVMRHLLLPCRCQLTTGPSYSAHTKPFEHYSMRQSYHQRLVREAYPQLALEGPNNEFGFVTLTRRQQLLDDPDFLRLGLRHERVYEYL